MFYLLLATVAATQQLVYVEEIVRHGARAPGDDEIFPWAKDPSQNFEEGMKLSTMGMRQHYLIGREIRQRYLIDQQLLGQKWNQDDFKFYSTNSHRTYESGESQISGLFPPEDCVQKLNEF